MYDSIQESTYSAQVKITQVGWLYSSGFETPKTGNEYLVVYITIKNLGPDAIHSLSPTDFQALDSNGVVHDSAYLTSLTDCYPDIVDLLPNGTMSGCIPFEVPLNGRIEFIYAPFNYEGLVSGRYLSFIVRP
jgi:hypothetical protein